MDGFIIISGENKQRIQLSSSLDNEGIAVGKNELSVNQDADIETSMDGGEIVKKCVYHWRN
jgi:hypothetical protein